MSDFLILNSDILWAIYDDDPQNFPLVSHNNCYKTTIIRKVYLEKSKNLLAFLININYFDTFDVPSIIGFINWASNQAWYDIFELLCDKAISLDWKSKYFSCIVNMAIQNKRFEYVNDLIKSIDASNFYKCYYDYCLESNVKSAEFLILSGVPINTTGPMGMPSDNLADLALKSSNLDMTKLCVKYDLIEFPISDNIILDKHIKAEIYKFYLWHNRSGIAYARYYVPFVQKISKNMFREIITYF